MSKGRVLVLDDDPWHVSWISDLAETIGFDCEFVSTFDEAKASFERSVPKIAVVDIRIGDVDAPLVGATLQAVDPQWVGLRFLRFVRVERADSKTPLFVYTGLDREGLQKVVEGSYQARFFTKFDPSRFRNSLAGELKRLT